MFIQNLDAAMEPYRYLFAWRKSTNKLLMMPTKTIEDRFKLLLELFTLSWSLNYWKIEDIENPNYTFEYNVCYKLLAEAAMYVTNTWIVSVRYKELIQYLASEFINEVGQDWDFSLIPKIYLGEISAIQFLAKKTKINNNNTAYLFKAKSGIVYQWNNLKDLAKLTQDILFDIIEWINEDEDLNLNDTQKKVLDYIINKKSDLVSKFKNHRVCLIAFINWMYSPEIRNNVIVFILEELNIPHEYGPPTQAAVIAIKKAKAKQQNA